MKLFETCYDNNMQLEALKQADYFRQCSYAGLPSFMFPGTEAILKKTGFDVSAHFSANDHFFNYMQVPI